MKRISLFATLICLCGIFTFSSCSKDDDDAIPKELIGEWLNVKTELFADGELFLSYEDKHTDTDYYLWKFEGNGTLDVTNKVDGAIVKHEKSKIVIIDGNTIEETQEDGDKFFMTYEVSGDKLKIRMQDKTDGIIYESVLSFIRKK